MHRWIYTNVLKEELRAFYFLKNKIFILVLYYYINSGLMGLNLWLALVVSYACGHVLTQIQLFEGLRKLGVWDSSLVDNFCYLSSMGSHEIAVKTPTEVLN